MPAAVGIGSSIIDPELVLVRRGRGQRARSIPSKTRLRRGKDLPMNDVVKQKVEVKDSPVEWDNLGLALSGFQQQEKQWKLR